MKMKKRFLGILLSLVMVLGLMPGMALVAKAEATQWVVGDSINLNGKYFIPDEMEAKVYLGIDESVAIPQPEFDSVMNQWRFRCEIPATVAHGYVYCRLPSGKTKEEAPAGFKIAGGTGTSDDPYTFGLVYQKDVDDAKVIAQAMEEVHARMGSDMIFSGSPIQLIDPPTTVLPDGYSMVYAVTVDNTAPDSTAYGASIPTATDAGTYYVWYKVKGDANHEDSTVSEPVTVTISPVNKDALNAAISAAEAYYDEIKGNADYAAIAETLKQAIDAAKAVAGNDNATEEQVNATVSSVTEAVKTAKADKEAAESIDIANCNISVKNQTYTGKALKPAVTVKYGEATLKKGTDYTVTYKNNTKIGLATVTVKGKGHCTGSRKLTFKICPKGTKFTKVEGGKRQIVLKWKNPKNVTGYVLQYSLKENFSSKRTVIIRKAGTLSRTIGNLKANKTYYVRIRSYATVNKEHYRSAWSKVVAVKTKAGNASNGLDGQAVEATIEATAEGEDMTLVLDGELDEALLSEDIVVLPEALPEEDIPLSLAD